ncbi:hypothetical protein D3C75_807230 [compost metagenome]
MLQKLPVLFSNVQLHLILLKNSFGVIRILALRVNMDKISNLLLVLKGVHHIYGVTGHRITRCRSHHTAKLECRINLPGDLGNQCTCHQLMVCRLIQIRFRQVLLGCQHPAAKQA